MTFHQAPSLSINPLFAPLDILFYLRDRQRTGNSSELRVSIGCDGHQYSSLLKVKRVKDLEDTFADRELEKPVYFGDLPHPAHMPEIGYKSVEDLDSQTLDKPCHIRTAYLHRWKPNRGQSRCGPYRMARQRGDIVLDATTRSLLHGLPGGYGRAAKSDRGR
ncbi:hypothetical protein EVAR_49247_1 [Eumeta japonica]|uniref:Uncharacterized protein n=1 Tax=Eumeta variegata TaxID=151549 RepID=A0A4C1YH10_EUMVA|nr:hypothetical protein EVAR_49247_1 [Eumeta japonica]